MIIRLAHLAFDTDNAGRMVAFYTDILGLRVQFTMDLDDGTTSMGRCTLTFAFRWITFAITAIC